MEDSDRRMRDADGRIRDLDDRVDDLEGRLDNLESDHQRLSSKFGYTEDLDDELRSIRGDISSCEHKIEEVDEELRDRVSDIDQAVRRLLQHVRLVEGQLMASGGAQLADLDTFTKDQCSLARRVERGWQARSLLLSDHDRSTFQYRLRHHGETAEQHRAHRTTVIDTVGTLTGTRYGARARAQAATELRDALTRERRLRQDLDRQTRPAKEAEDALAADAKTRAENQSVMAAAARAEK